MIALDGADSKLLDALTASGEAPVMASLRRRGRFTLVQDEAELSDDSIWASFCYGKPIQEHGRHYAVLPLKSGELGMAIGEEDADETFWSRLSASGARVAIVDVPKCPTPKPLNGIQLADWLVHGRFHDRPVSYPETLADKVIARFGPAPPSRCDYFQDPLGDDDIIAFAATLLRAVAQKTRAAVHFLAQEDWDLFIAGFKEAHCAGHMLWHMHDRDHPDYDAARTRRLGDPVLAVFKALDGAIGQLLDAAGEDAQIIIFSTTEMAPNGSIWPLAHDLQRRLNGYLFARYGTTADFTSRPGTRRYRPLFRRLCRALPASDNLIAFNILKQDDRRHEAVCREVERILNGLEDPSVGASPFTSVFRPSSCGANAQGRRLPDIVARCRPGRFPTTLDSAELGRLDADPQPMRSGNHADGGAILSAGDSVLAHTAHMRALHQLAAVAAAVCRPDRDRPAPGKLPAQRPEKSLYPGSRPAGSPKSG